MSDTIQKHDIPEELLDQLLAQVDDPKELLGSGGLLRSLMGRLVEKSLEVELTQHLGYDKGAERAGDNARNGSTPKTLITEAGKVAVRVPRDRAGSFEPELVRKHQRRSGWATPTGPRRRSAPRCGCSGTSSRRPPATFLVVVGGLDEM